MKGRITWGDKVLAIGLALCTLGSFFGLQYISHPGSTVIVELKDLVVYKSSLAENRKITVRGDYGDVRIQVNEGRVAVVHADCPNKVCVRTGWRSLAGDAIICVPNRVLIRIVGAQTKHIRGITG
ncbi:MAG: NusG domain II-containing protein [Bacteroidetes bacterium]|nr:NusG domain II-containing protein [Bacteroidota bacterium]MCW5894460.1 NusG domain II-containing protein [Bacteroidota bacterium]